MNRSVTLGMKITLAMVLTVTLALSAVLAVVTMTIHQRLRSEQQSLYLQIATARADQLGEMFKLAKWQLSLAADLPGFRTGDDQEAIQTVKALNNKLSPEVRQLVWANTRGEYSTSEGARGNISDRSYFKAVVGEGKDWYVSEAVISKSLGVPIVVVAVPIRTVSGTTVGLLGALIGLKELSSITAKIRSGETGYGWVTDSTGLILAHPTAEAIMKLNVTHADRDGFHGLDALGIEMVKGQLGSGEFTKPDGTSFTTFYSPIEGSPGWTLGISVASVELFGTEASILVTLVTVLVLAILLSLGVAALLGRQLSQPLRRASEAFQALAEGDADLTRQLAVRSTDEVGQLTSDFNVFLAKLRLLVGGVKDARQTLQSVSQELSQTTQATAKTSSEVSSRVSDIQKNAKDLSSGAQEASTAVEQVASNIESLDRLILNQAASLTQASASVEEMVSTIASIRNSAQVMAHQFQELVGHADSGHATHSEAVGKIQAIADQSESLLEANRIIADIAAQTNLLAMNAAIEAAHAGAAGRGFSVVADEIRKLSQTSAAQSRSIGEALKAVQRVISTALESSAKSERSFDQIKAKVVETEVVVRSVFTALEEQQEGSTQILEALREINQITSEVRDGSHEMKQGNQVILGEIGRVREGAVEISGAMNLVDTEMNRLAKSTLVLDRLVVHTSKTVEAMEFSVGKFRV